MMMVVVVVVVVVGVVVVVVVVWTMTIAAVGSRLEQLDKQGCPSLVSGAERNTEVEGTGCMHD